MKIEVFRSPSQPDWTLSKFYIDGVLKGVGVEDEKRDKKVKGETCIPEGEYKMDLRFSPKFSKYYYRNNNGSIISSKRRTTEALKKEYHTQHEMIWVKDVPGFEYILWHWGNTDDDTEGCYIVGTEICYKCFNGQDGVTASRKKYEEIYPLIWMAINKGTVNVKYTRMI